MKGKASRIKQSIYPALWQNTQNMSTAFYLQKAQYLMKQGWTECIKLHRCLCQSKAITNLSVNGFSSLTSPSLWQPCILASKSSVKKVCKQGHPSHTEHAVLFFLYSSNQTWILKYPSVVNLTFSEWCLEIYVVANKVSKLSVCTRPTELAAELAPSALGNLRTHTQ